MDQALIYKNNLKALKDSSPKLYEKLLKVETNIKYDVYAGGKDPLDINIYDTEKKINLYKNPVQDTLLQIDEFSKYSRYPLLVFFGFGNGVFLKSMLHGENLTHMIVIEPEIEILYIALHFLDYTDELKSKKLTIFHIDDFDYYSIRYMISNAGFSAYLKTYTMHLTLSYYGSYKTMSLKANSIFIDAILHYVHSHGNDTKDSLIGVEHFVANIPLMLKNCTFSSLKANKNTNTAVMVSTGPSLSKQLKQLKEIQNFVTIICIDASLPILEQNGIQPDIVCSLERVVETAKFFEQTSKEMHDKTIFVSSALQHKKIYENIKGGQLCVAMRPFEYMKYFSFDDFGYTGIGLSAANMGLEIAYLMKFDNLIIIGQDLAYGDDGSSHAIGHVYGESEKQYEDTDSFIVGWGGDRLVRTSAVWRLFLNFFIADIADIEGKMSIINATEGGARIDGTIEMTFENAIKSVVNSSVIKKPIVLSKHPNEIYKLNIRRAKESVDDILEFAQNLKEQIEELFLLIAKECDNLTKLNMSKNLDLIDFGYIKELLSKIDGIKEQCSKQKFKSLLWESVQSFFLSIEMENAVIAVKPAPNEDAVKAKLVEFLFAHKPFLFLLAGGIDAFISVVNRSKKTLLVEFDCIMQAS